MVSRSKAASPHIARSPERFRKLIGVAMEFERRTMQLYCRYEMLFPKPAEVRAFWFDMAEHESRHYGALAMVAGLLECAPERTLPVAPALTRDHVIHLRALLDTAEAEAREGLPLTHALETALEIECSEIEDLVLDLLSALKGERERERAAQNVIHDLGDLSYIVEKFGNNRALLARVDRVIEQQVARLRTPAVRPVPRARAARAR
jgi:hypothetical protein